MTARLYAALKVATAVACAYEAATIPLDSDRLPTISRLCGRHRWLAPVIVGALITHLYWRPSAQS